MAQPVLMTPGVYFNEIDLSQYIKLLSSTLLAIVGVANRGVVNSASLMTTPNQLANTFGIATENYPALKVANDFLTAGGSTCWFVRVTNGEDMAAATGTIAEIGGGGHTLTLTAAETGSFFNNMSAQISYSGQAGGTFSNSETLTASTPTDITLSPAPIVAGTVQISFNSVLVATDDGAGNLVFVSGGLLAGATGTVNYNTGAVVITPESGLAGSPVTHTMTASFNYFSTFDLQLLLTVLDENSEVVKLQVIESYSGLTVSNFLTQLASPTNIETPAAINTFPVAGTYDFSGGDDGASMIDDTEFVGNDLADVPTGLQIFANPDTIDINTVCVPGNSSNAVREAVITLCSTQRADSIGIIDPPSDTNVTTVADWANAANSFSAYAALYFPWYSSTNNVTGDTDLTPPSAAAVQAFAVSDFWQAPAGPNRGLIADFAGIAIDLTPGDRLFLGNNRINPLSNLKGLGVMVLGQQTATLLSSSLDRVAARRMILSIEKSVTTAMYAFLFEPNTQTTWNRVVNVIQPYLDSLVNADQIYAGKVYCDAITNTVENINNNIMTAYVVLQLLKYAEIIVVNFEAVAYGVTISESLISNNTSN
jgi:phage tail sheath protein FI